MDFFRDHRARAEVILFSLKGDGIFYALRFKFKTTNN